MTVRMVVNLLFGAKGTELYLGESVNLKLCEVKLFPCPSLHHIGFLMSTTNASSIICSKTLFYMYTILLQRIQLFLSILLIHP